MKDFSLLNGVEAAVFAVTRQSLDQNIIRAWSKALAVHSGVPSKSAILRSVRHVLGEDANIVISRFRTAESEKVSIPGLGQTVLRSSQNVVIGTVCDREREDFLGLAAHDLRAPLRNVRFLAETAMETAQADPRWLQKIAAISKTTLALTDEVIASVQAIGTKGGELRNISLSEISNLVFSTLDPNHKHDLCCEEVDLFVERPVLLIGLRNLIDNAIRHGGKEKLSIQIAARQLKDFVEISVSDDGQGFRDPALRFLGGEDLRYDSGFGLVGFRRMIMQKGGQIWVRQPENSSGSVVSFTLPGTVVANQPLALTS